MSPFSETKATKSEARTLPVLFAEEETPLLRYAYSLVGRRAVAEDIVQDVFLQLHSHWETVENPVAWLYRSVRNRSFNHHRDHRRELGGEDYDRSEDEKAEAPADVLSRMEATGFLRMLISELDDADRKVVELKYFEDRKYQEISELTGLSVSNVGYRLHHILKQLADKLRHLGIEGSQ